MVVADLPEIGPDRPRTIYLREAAQDFEIFAEGPEWPSGIGPVKARNQVENRSLPAT